MKDLICLIKIIVDIFGLLSIDKEWLGGRLPYEVGFIDGPIWVSGWVGEWSMSVSSSGHVPNKFIVLNKWLIIQTPIISK